MLRCFLKSKIHLAKITEANILYEGSITIDEEIMNKAGILEYEQVVVSNLNNGERLETYAISGKKGSKIICLNGPAARKGIVGDRVIIFSYCYLNEQEIKKFNPKIIYLDDKNNIKKNIRSKK